LGVKYDQRPMLEKAGLLPPKALYFADLAELDAATL
jgi:hypothetical protein